MFDQSAPPLAGALYPFHSIKILRSYRRQTKKDRRGIAGEMVDDRISKASKNTILKNISSINWTCRVQSLTHTHTHTHTHTYVRAHISRIRFFIRIREERWQRPENLELSRGLKTFELKLNTDEYICFHRSLDFVSVKYFSHLWYVFCDV